MTSQSHPSHAAGEATGAARSEQLGGAKDLTQGLGRGAGRACCGDSTSTGGAQDSTVTGSTRLYTGQSIRACLRRVVPADHEAHSQTQRRQLRRVAQIFGGSAPRRPKQEAGPRQDAAKEAAGTSVARAEHASHDRIHTPVNPLGNSSPQRERTGEDGDVK